MIHEARYTILSNGKRSDVPAPLYQSCKDLLQHLGSGETCIKQGRRHVAFFCNWRKTIVPMFDASEQERHVLKSWYGEAR